MRKAGGRGPRRGIMVRQLKRLIPPIKIEDSKGLSPLVGFGAKPQKNKQITINQSIPHGYRNITQ